ncbi:MAG TPA: putative Ig domain-containing protein, partial [Verrucomicrobiae bacterium]|nr:putative Ig domain-containing protein [Verrucomicrobiae bacterium]
MTVGEHVVLGAIVVTSAGEVITGYQWFVSTDSHGPFNPSAQTSALVFDNIQASDAGYYYATVTYQSLGGTFSVSSTPVQLTVDGHPKIIIQPVDGDSQPGSNATFSVTAAGMPPLSYLWRHDSATLTDDDRITGSHTNGLQIQNVFLSDGGNYDVVVANAFGSITSQVAVLNVAYVPPAITSVTNAIGKQGHAFNYTITAIGTPAMTFGASGLPDGLSVISTNGVISGIPQVAGVFDITLLATNAGAQTTATDLFLTLADDIPVLISATNAIGTQGFPFTYTITATNDPAWFNAESLPLGLSVDNATGIISGTPLVAGPFSITIDVTNAFGAASQTLTLNLASGAPLITSTLTKTGKQGQTFSYTIKATNNPASYGASQLPDGLTLNPLTGVISGIPLVNGLYSVPIGAVNQFGFDNQTLLINLTTGAPTITSSLTAKGTEETNFSYTIKANNSPTSFWATDLPIGLKVNTNNGAITGVPLYAGSYNVPLFAANAWGVGTATLQLNITNLPISGLWITNIMPNYASPYLLEYTFSLRDSADPVASRAVVVPPPLLSVQAFEDGVLVSSSETGVILEPATSKVLKGYLVLDFTASVASLANGDANSNGISDAVEAEIASAQDFVNQQPAGSQIGVYEFHRDDEDPQQVIALTKDKALLTSAIGGIWTNYVNGFPAASRAWDALGAAVAALGPTNSDETHYIVFMSDGRDDSSTNTIDNVIQAATNANVQIFTVGFGDELDSLTLPNLSASTFGRFYFAGTNVSALALSFAEIGKDLSSQYILRWATLKRSSKAFLPSFQISYQGFNATSPPPPAGTITGTNFTYVTNNGTIDTNQDYTYTTNYIVPPFTPTTYAGNVLGGFLRLVSDADVHPEDIILRATYVPRYIRQLRVHYRANWPVSLSLNTTNSGGLLDGWSLTQTNDGAGGQWASLTCADPSNLDLSIPFATFGNLLTFSFNDPITASNAFSAFEIDNTIYTNTAGT